MPFDQQPIGIHKIIAQKNCMGKFAYSTGPPFPSWRTFHFTYQPTNFGSSGFGKPTIARLLLRMYQPQEGTVLLDDTHLRYLNPTWVHGNVGQGMGDVVLEGESITENVALGIEDATEEMIEEACRAALFHEFVRDLSDGTRRYLAEEGWAVLR
jgi:ATP-binding cassette subfamily B (MDR/TAP) protein 1